MFTFVKNTHAVIKTNPAAVALLSLITACGSSTTSNGQLDAMEFDGPYPSDASIDARLEFGRVKVLMTMDGPSSTIIPRANAAVAFCDPAGTLLAETRTDAQGRASATVPRGGMVSLLVPAVVVDGVQVGKPKIFTYFDLVPGSELVVGPPLSPRAITTKHVILPSAGDRYTSYYIETPCSRQFGGRIMDVAFATDCTSDWLYVSTQDSQLPQKTLVLFGIDLAPNATLDLSAQQLVLDRQIKVTGLDIPRAALTNSRTVYFYTMFLQGLIGFSQRQGATETPRDSGSATLDVEGGNPERLLCSSTQMRNQAADTNNYVDTCRRGLATDTSINVTAGVTTFIEAPRVVDQHQIQWTTPIQAHINWVAIESQCTSMSGTSFIWKLVSANPSSRAQIPLPPLSFSPIDAAMQCARVHAEFKSIPSHAELARAHAYGAIQAGEFFGPSDTSSVYADWLVFRD
jgi:hypothetical protein